MARVLYQGHGSLRLQSESGAVVYIDPFAGDGYDLPADLILITHQHSDHNDLMRPAKKRGCVVIDNADALADGDYKRFELLDMRVEATQAYNKNHRRDQCVGYLVSVDGVLCYFAGDTSSTEQMKTLSERKIDYCFLPTDGVYNMDAAEATRCAKLIGAKHAIPVHMKPGALFNELVARAFTAPNRIVLAPGDELELKP